MMDAALAVDGEYGITRGIGWDGLVGRPRFIPCGSTVSRRVFQCVSHFNRTVLDSCGEWPSSSFWTGQIDKSESW